MKKRVLLFLVIAGLVVAAPVAAVLHSVLRPQTTSNFAMGSVLTQTYWGRQLMSPSYEDCADMVVQYIRELERELNAAEESPPEALLVMKASDGAFAPWLGALVKLWNINDEPYLPTQEEIDEALQKRELDLGAYGKGAACDIAHNIVPITVKAAVVNLGGNIMTYGRKPWGQLFKIALRDPKGGLNDTMGMFRLKGTNFISTSGSYEKYFEQDGKKYHHIFDPETGYPAGREPGLISLTAIIGDKHVNRIGGGALGDMISTACFVLGYEASRDLLARYECDAIFVYENGEVRGAGDVKEYFKLDTSKYHWSEA